MGSFFAKLFGGGRQEQWRVLLLGLDAAGKTTTLYALKHHELKDKQKGKKKKTESKEDEDDDEADAIPTVPTIGFNVETVEYNNLKFNVWDVGGQDRLRPLWRQYYSGTHGIMFIVDSNDTAIERIQRAKEELHGLMNEIELRNARLAVVLNKRDLAENTKITRKDGTVVDNTIEFWKQELQLEEIQTKRVNDLKSRIQQQDDNKKSKKNKKNSNNDTIESIEEKRYYAAFPAIAKSLSNQGIFDALDWLQNNMEQI